MKILILLSLLTTLASVYVDAQYNNKSETFLLAERNGEEPPYD